MLKNVYDKSVPSRNLITTISSLVTLVLTLLVTFGVISLDQSTALADHANTLVTACTTIYGVILSIILLFAKDPSA